VVERYCQQRGLALIYLLPPTAENERVKEIVSRSSGFVYLVSLTGVTGARKQLPPSLQAFVRKVRATTDLPLAVGLVFRVLNR
jgi:tryptophan synthase alpha chain